VRHCGSNNPHMPAMICYKSPPCYLVKKSFLPRKSVFIAVVFCHLHTTRHTMI
jgi:hypothetical protein